MTQSPKSLAGIELRLQPRELTRHWQRCGQTADWISSYLVHDVEQSAKAHLKNVFSTVINELLENAVKFSTPDAPDITIAVRHHGTFVRIETRNLTSYARAERLEKTLEDLAQSALDALFARRVAMGSDADAPGVGLLIIKRDYGARVRAVLTPRSDGTRDVHVIVDLDLAARPM